MMDQSGKIIPRYDLDMNLFDIPVHSIQALQQSHYLCGFPVLWRRRDDKSCADLITYNQAFFRREGN